MEYLTWKNVVILMLIAWTLEICTWLVRDYNKKIKENK